jgi:hypothetical protein
LREAGIDVGAKLALAWTARGRATFGQPNSRVSGKSKGRSRKPLAEVIFKNAPLRATSSAVSLCIQRANHKLLKIGHRVATVTW